VTQHHEGLKPASDLAILRWQQLMAQALTGLNTQVRSSTRDEAPGLLGFVAPACGLITWSAGWRDTTLQRVAQCDTPWTRHC